MTKEEMIEVVEERLSNLEKVENDTPIDYAEIVAFRSLLEIVKKIGVGRIGKFILDWFKNSEEYVSGNNIDSSVCIDGNFDLKNLAQKLVDYLEKRKE